MGLMCTLGLHSYDETERYSLTSGGEIVDSDSSFTSNYIFVVSRCSRCGHRRALKKSLSNLSSLTENWDMDVVDELIDRYRKRSTRDALREL